MQLKYPVSLYSEFLLEGFLDEDVVDVFRQFSTGQAIEKSQKMTKVHRPDLNQVWSSEL